MHKKIGVLELVLLLMLVLTGFCMLTYLLGVDNASLEQIDVKHLVYVVSSDEPIHVDHMRIASNSGVLVVTMMNGVKMRLSPHEWKRVVEVLE